MASVLISFTVTFKPMAENNLVTQDKGDIRVTTVLPARNPFTDQRERKNKRLGGVHADYPTQEQNWDSWIRSFIFALFT